MLKKFLCLSMLLLLVVGCGGGSKELDMDAFTKNVIESVEYDDELLLLTENVAKDTYNLGFEGLEKYTIYVSATQATSNELAVMKVKDEKSMDVAKKAAVARLEDLKAKYVDYRPDEMQRLDTALIVSQGNYLLLSVSPNNDAVQKLFTASFK